tara:strand:- start:3200 stop:5818 length:2619 start_codon:yes stop_codon:yes gene_type:complete
MPKIPTFQAEGSIEQLQGTTTNIQVGLNQTIGDAIKPATNALVKFKIKENDLQNKTEALKLENNFINDMQSVYEKANILSNKEQAQTIIKNESNALIEKYASQATNNATKTLFSNYALSEVQKGMFRSNTAVSKNILTELDNNVNLKKERLLTTAFLSEGGFDYSVLETDLAELYTFNYKSKIPNAQLKTLIEGIPGEIEAYEATKNITDNPKDALTKLLNKDFYPNLTLENRQKLITNVKNVLLPKIDNDWKNYVAAAALGKEPVPFDMDFAKKVLPADTITEMENQLETIDDTIGKVKILNSINSKELKQTIEQYELEIDAKVQAGAIDFLVGEKKKEYYNNIINNRQELLATDPAKFIIDTNEDIKAAVETIESTEDIEQKNILEAELATAMIQIQTDLGVPKYNQKVMTSDQSKSFVNTYKKSDQNTRIAMLQGLDLQFGDLNNKAFQQLLNDGLPETAILSSYFQNPEMTEAFLSFDSPEKKTELKDWGTKNGVKFNKLQKDIATSKAIRIFEDIVATNTGANSADTVEQMGNIVEILTYYTLNEMFTNNKNEVTARKDAVGIIKNNFQIEDTYYIPKIWDGKKLLDSHIDIIVAKTEIIKDHYLDQWGAVAFGSMKDDTLTVDIESEFEINMKENGEWRNTSDGEGLIFGIVLADGEFAPVKNANGDFLEFDFDNDTYILPGTDIKLNMKLNDFVQDEDQQATLITDENLKPRLVSLVETNKFFNYVKKKEGSFFETATQATEGETKLTIGYGRYGAAEGQTVNKEEAEQMLLEDIESRIPEIINAIPKFDSFSDELQQALFYEWFRGSLVQSPKTRKLINEGKFSEAAKEFLNNDEYKNARKNKRSGVISHFELTAKLLNKEGTI